MKRFWNLLLCALFDAHENKRCERLGWRPLFPVVCDHCAELFYMRQWTDDEREAWAAAQVWNAAESVARPAGGEAPEDNHD